jgi:hypothetical protein
MQPYFAEVLCDADVDALIFQQTIYRERRNIKMYTSSSQTQQMSFMKHQLTALIPEIMDIPFGLIPSRNRFLKF